MTGTPAADCWFLTGPTAAGKTDVGIELARRLGAEIVSLDSMALYRGMDIGTAKPTPQQRAAVPHHLIDVIEPHEEYSLARYLDEAARCVAEIRGRGREALFVGGTPLYLKGLLRGIFEGPPADRRLRRALREEAQRDGPETLHRRLARLDPAAAERLHPNDLKRIIRALEVYEKTGRPISELQRQFEAGRQAEECRVFVLDRPRAELHERINRRVDAMFAAGLVGEVRGLLRGWGGAGGRGTIPFSQSENCIGRRGTVPFSQSENCIGRRGTVPFSQSESGDTGRRGTVPFSLRENWDSPLSRTARQAVGYREVIEHLRGERGLAETVELVKRHTRQMAKRQMTWFRSLSECRFVAVEGGVEPAEVAAACAFAAETTRTCPNGPN